MSPNNKVSSFAEELKIELQRALHVSVHHYIYRDAAWSIAVGDICDDKNDCDELCFQQALKHFAFDCKSAQHFKINNAVVLALRTNELRATPSVIAVKLQDQNEQLVAALMESKLETIQCRQSLTKLKMDADLYIEQITQDFEELTWIRGAYDQLDLGDHRNSIDSAIQQCLAVLANVVHAEDITFVKSNFQNGRERVKMVCNATLSADAIACRLHLVAHFRDDTKFQTVIVNARPHQPCIEGFPGIRNCMVHAVCKGTQLYGWLLTTNRLTRDNTLPDLQLGTNPLSEYQFGTFESGLVKTAANILASNARNIELFAEQDALMVGIIRAIVNAIDAKDPYTCGHSDRVARFAKSIAERVGIDSVECERIYMSGLLHDVGKIGVPDAILGKPGKLTDDEFDIVKKHPEIGYGILKHLHQLSYVLPGVLHHHEAINGTGYPHGLKGEAIPLAGRVLAVADAYDAMTSTRPYRDGMPTEKAERILTEGAGKTWDTRLVQGLLECIEEGVIVAADPASLKQTMKPKASEKTSSALLMDRIATAINGLASV